MCVMIYYILLCGHTQREDTFKTEHCDRFQAVLTGLETTSAALHNVYGQVCDSRFDLTVRLQQILKMMKLKTCNIRPESY